MSTSNQLQRDDAPITIRTRKMLTNRLLGRRQCILDVDHPSRSNVPQSVLASKIAYLYKAESTRVAVFGMRIIMGGGRSTGYALIYDSEDVQRRYEPKYRLMRSGLLAKQRPVGHHLRGYYKRLARTARKRRKIDAKKTRRAQNR